MQVHFADQRLAEAAENPRAAARLLGELAERFLDRLEYIESADDLRSLMAIRALRMHPLKGQRRSQWAIRLNRNFRLVVSIHGEDVIVESVEDYHGD